MLPERLHNALRLAFAALAVVAMTFQYARLDALGAARPANFFSFFTIQSNLIGVAALALLVLWPRAGRPRWLEIFRGAATLYMAITGVVFALLLSGLQEDLQTSVGWVDGVVHKLMPIVLVLDFLLDPPRRRLSPRVALLWLAYPLAWFAYTLIRGAAVDWYPYPFVDVARHGYGRVAVNAVVLAACFAVAALALAWLGNRLGERRRAATEPA